MKATHLKYLVVVLSVSFFLISLSQPAFDYQDSDGSKIHSSISLLFMGGISLLGGALLEWMVWLANPLFVIALVLFIKDKPRAIYMAVGAALLALSFSFWREILAAENGRHAPISKLRAGYYLWFASIVTLVIGIAAYRTKLIRRGDKRAA